MAVADKNAARELELYIDNDGALYERRKAFYSALDKKVKQGVFDKAKAAKLFAYFVKEGAIKYSKEYGGTYSNNFSKPTRDLVAAHFVAGYMSEKGIRNPMAKRKKSKRNPTEAELELAKAYAEVAGPGKARVNPSKRKKMSAKTKAYLKALKKKRLHAKPKRKAAKRRNFEAMGAVTAVMPSVSAHLRPKIGHAPRASRGGASLTPRSSQISNPGVKALEHKLDTVLRALKKKTKSVVKKAKKARKASKNPYTGYTLRYYSARGKLIGSQKARVTLAAAKRAARAHVGKTWLGRKIVKVMLTDGRK